MQRRLWQVLLPVQTPEGKGEVVKDSPWKARMRYAKIGGAAVAGGAILGLTGRASLALLIASFPAPARPFALHIKPCSATVRLWLGTSLRVQSNLL